MKILLDTHALLWWLQDNPRLGGKARQVIADPANSIFVSVASLWEIAIKQHIGKLDADAAAIAGALEEEGLTRLDILPAHLAHLVTLPRHHGDPFDHLLIAQAASEGAALMTADRRMAGYEVKRIGCG